jgi:hypothetical protein
LLWGHGLLSHVFGSNKILGPLVKGVTFLLFFMTSGYGFITAITVISTGPELLQDKSREAIAAFGHLESVVATSFKDKEYDEYKRRLESDFSRLEGEVLNENGGKTCGFGPNATAVVADIHSYLPSFSLLTGSKEYDCSRQADLKRVLEQHRAIANKALEAKFAGSAYRRDQVAALQQSIFRKRAEVNRVLGAHVDRLQGLSFLDRFSMGIFREVRSALRNANQEYQVLREKVERLDPAVAKELDPEINIDAIEGLNNAGGGFAFVFEVLTTMRVYYPVIAALFFIGVDAFSSRNVRALFERASKLHEAFEVLEKSHEIALVPGTLIANLVAPHHDYRGPMTAESVISEAAA